MHPRLILLRLIVTKPLQSLLEDVSQVIENGVGRTKLIEEENDAFIDDIVEERLIVNYQEKKAYVVYRVFVNSKKDNHQSYINVGWVINEGMPVCNLCRKSLHKDHEKEHCHACGNVFCHACCNHSSIIEGLEDEGPLLGCNLCDYGQDIILPVTTRSFSRFEILNLSDVQRGVEREMRVRDSQNSRNLSEGVEVNSICLQSIRIDAELLALKSQVKQGSNRSLNLEAPLTNESLESSNFSQSNTPRSQTLNGNALSKVIVGAKPEFMAELENQEDPPVLTGWLKKKEDELIIGWKTRYFVLIRGFLYIYMDKLDQPPFGRYLKSQICLAGYRVFAETPAFNRNTNRNQYQNHLEQLNSIHLIYSSGICSMEEVLLLAKDLSLDANYFNSYHSDSHLADWAPELLLEAENYDDRMTWFLTIKHHITYIEGKLKQQASLPTASFSLTPAAIGVTSRESSSSSSDVFAIRASTVNNFRSSLVTAPALQDNEEDLQITRLTISTKNKTDDDEDDDALAWQKFLLPTEEVIFSGSVCKPDVSDKKLLVFVKNTKHSSSLPFQTKPAEPNPLLPKHLREREQHQYVKRLLYIDPERDKVKGQIKWYPDEKMPKVRKIDDRCFEIIDYHVHKAYLFYPRHDCTVNQWIQVFEQHNT